MKQIILGTAGHIDHGKTSLIKAVTGIDTDRLIEEKERGITIELGFAALDLPSGQHLGIVDVPGHEKFVKNMVAGATGIDIVLMVIEAGQFGRDDRQLADSLLERADSTILVLNKIDRLKKKDDLLPILKELADEFPFAAFVPVSARRGSNLAGLVDEIVTRLPEGPELFPRTMRTDRDETFRIAEIIREKLLGAVHEEVPYGLTVEIEHFGPFAQAR